MSNYGPNWPWDYNNIPNVEARKLFALGEEALGKGDHLAALSLFEKAVRLECHPAHCSFMAVCIARERGQYTKAIDICRSALKMEPGNSLHYLNLGRVNLLMGNKDEAIRNFREGLNIERSPRIIEELNLLGIRRPPVIHFLKRENPINKLLGIVLRRIGLR
ncbi:MAG: tetratricopeptide repeat protein [Geobacteraceae bacterium]